MRKVFLQILILFSVVLSVSCSSESDNATETTSKAFPAEVTNEQAQLLASVLYNNHLDENASYIATSGTVPGNGFISQGKVDWSKSIVVNDVSLSSKTQVDLSSITTNEGVFETVLNLEEAQRQAGLEPRDWVFRPFDPTVYGVDAFSQFVIKLASTSPDNPILIKQNNAQFLGTETIAGELTYKLQNSSAVTYFITEQGELKKVTARIKGFENEVSLLFSERNNTNIEVPNQSDSYNLNQVISFYTSIRPAF